MNVEGVLVCFEKMRSPIELRLMPHSPSFRSWEWLHIHLDAKTGMEIKPQKK